MLTVVAVVFALTTLIAIALEAALVASGSASIACWVIGAKLGIGRN